MSAALTIHEHREPDKAAIAAGLKNGDVVRGAEWSNGGTGLTVRTR